MPEVTKIEGKTVKEWKQGPKTPSPAYVLSLTQRVLTFTHSVNLGQFELLDRIIRVNPALDLSFPTKFE